MFKKITINILCLLILYGCTAKHQSREDEIVSKASYFNKPESISNLPENLLTALEKNRIIFFGETHYVEEHTLMLSLLLEAAYQKGYRYLFIEDMGANSYLYDLFVKDEFFLLDDETLGLYKDILLEVRRINAELKLNENEMISISCFDLNHKNGVFKNAVTTILKINKINRGDILNTSQSLEQKSALYEEDLRFFSSILSLNEDNIEPKIIKILQEVTEIELKTLEYKKYYSWKFRENFMFDNIDKKIDQFHNKDKVIINTHFWHAQKKNQWDEGIEGLQTIGERFQNKYRSQDLYHIVILGLKGEMKNNWADSGTYRFDFVNNSNGENLMKAIGEIDSSRYVFIDFKYHPINGKIYFGFYRENIEINPNIIFDGLLVYPEMNVSNVSLEYRKNNLNMGN